MSLDTIIRHRTQEKEMQLAGNLAMTKNDWLEKGGIYHGTLWEAKQQNYYTIRVCEKMGQPVSAEELQQAKDFAMCKSYYAEYLIKKGGKMYVPCVPVFFREIN